MAANPELCKICNVARLMGCKKDAVQQQIDSLDFKIRNWKKMIADPDQQALAANLQSKVNGAEPEVASKRAHLQEIAGFCTR
jgi:hypothetical protein